MYLARGVAKSVSPYARALSFAKMPGLLTNPTQSLCRQLVSVMWNKKSSVFVLGCVTLSVAIGCKPSPTSSSSGSTDDAPLATGTDITPVPRKASPAGRKVLRFPVRSDGPKSLDPAQGSTMYDNRCVCQIYETLLQMKYLVRPYELEPLLLESMPEVMEDGLTYRFKLKRGVHFHDDPCFPGGKGREIAAEDVLYSWRRLADQDVSLKNWWLFENTIVGFDAYRAEQNAAEKFDYDAPVEGFQIVNDYEFHVTLTEPVTRFLWVLAMFQTSIVPREAVESYGTRFTRHPVGTGPFTLAENDWIPKQGMALNRNPNYHECFYPAEHQPEDEQRGLHLAAGKKLPFVDRVEMTFFVEEQPMWLQFMSGNLDFSIVPKDNFSEVFNRRTRKLKSSMRKRGIEGFHVPLLDFIFLGFNMEDPLVGGDSDKNRYLRQAIALAIDWRERNSAFYNETARIYDGMIPPGLPGYPEGGRSEVNYRGQDLQRARELMVKAGYPNGEGLPTINYYTNTGSIYAEMAEMTVQHLSKIGVKLNVRLEDFSAFIESVNNKKAPFFSFAWHCDYPDPENNLQLFYGPNESPGSNHYNYKNPEFDKLYEQIRVMPPSDERTAIMERMRDMVTEDCPYIGSMARVRPMAVHPWLKNCKPTEDILNVFKYFDIQQ